MIATAPATSKVVTPRAMPDPLGGYVVARDRSRLGALLGLLVLFFAVPGIAAAAELSWIELAGGVRWDELPPERKDRALKNYRAYKNLSPEDRGRVDDGYRRWKDMSDDDKARIRDRYERKRKNRD